MRDVAKIAGVSTATVSRAMNNPERVSEELRARITSIAQHLGWVPHAAARALATRRSGTIGAIFPTLTHGDFPRAIQVLQRDLADAGYTLLLAISEYDREQELQQVRKLLERGVDGLVLVGKLHHPDVAAVLERYAVPVIHTFVYDPESTAICVGPDNWKALHRLTSYLIDLGHRRFGIIAQSTWNNDRAQARLQGIRDALAENAIAVHPLHQTEGRWDIAEGRALFRKIMQTPPRPTVVMCGNGYLAVGAMLESQAMGIRVPDEMSIVGYDEIEIMAELPIPMTTVKVSAEEVGRRAAMIMISRLGGPKEEPPYECPAEIIVRASSAPPPPEPDDGRNEQERRSRRPQNV